MYVDHFDELINEYKENRSELRKLILEIEELKTNVKDILPNNTDFRNRHLIDDKIKILTSFYDSILKMRQEISKTLKEEIELRRKYEEFTSSDSEEWKNMNEFDIIRSLVKKSKTYKDEENNE